jgi:hypothetical protein
LITTVLISLVILAGFIIRYPDTVDGQISVTASMAPVRLVANSAGKLHLLEQNKSIVKEGNVIAYIESGTDYRDVLLLDSVLKHYQPGKDNTVIFPFSLALGEMASAYNSFVRADVEYVRIKNTDIYATMRQILTRQIKADRDVVENMNKELELKRQIIEGSAEQLEKDKTLLSMAAIPEDEYENKRQSHLSKEEAFFAGKSSLYQTVRHQ